MLPSGDTSQLQIQTQAQSEGVEDDTPGNGIQRKVGEAVFISNKTDFKVKRLLETKHRHYNENIGIKTQYLSIYMHPTRKHQKIKQC